MVFPAPIARTGTTIVRVLPSAKRRVSGTRGENTPVDVVVRPEDVKIVDQSAGMLTGEVRSVTFKGVHYEMLVSDALRLESLGGSMIYDPLPSNRRFQSSN